MSAEVVPLHAGIVGSGATIEPRTVLQAAIDADLQDVVVLGYKKDRDGTIYAASSEGAHAALWIIEAAKIFLIRGGRD